MSKSEIKKLRHAETTSVNGYSGPSPYEIIEKINELVDVLNTHMEGDDE